jgi:hypothetical protein
LMYTGEPEKEGHAIDEERKVAEAEVLSVA